jgi:hypothetical protein
MHAEPQSTANAAPPHAALVLLELSRRARQAQSTPELRFMLVNDSHALASYRQGALWLAGVGVQALSGVLQVEANAPYALWLERVNQHLARQHQGATAVSAADLPLALAREWDEWLPADALWLPLANLQNPSATDANVDAVGAGALLLARDLPWTEHETALLAEWLDVWQHAWRGQFKPPPWAWKTWWSRARRALRPAAGTRWWNHKPLRWLALAALVTLAPVRLTVLAPSELVPAHPAVIRAPLDGVIDTFHVQPNQQVKKGQPLFGFDEALLQSKLDVTRQALATAETEYRQTMQQALSDPKSKAQLALLTGKIEEKRAEALFVADQLTRARVLAPQDGSAMFDDPSEWIGRPVAVGERIMRIAAPADVEVEAWVPLADAIPLADGAAVTLYLNASPLAPIEASLRYLAHDAVQRPDGGYAYRLRAKLDGTTTHRVGLKGTAKLRGRWVPLAYWVLRRPLAGIRAAIGW